MLTAVYVLISSEKDLYYEQTLLSVYSLRKHNPDINIVVLVDDKTKATLMGKRAELSTLVSEIKVIDVPQKYLPTERSRYIKTSFRHHLEGPLLFIDSDTVIAEDVRTVENIEAQIACVNDCNCPLYQRRDKDKIVRRINDVYGVDISEERNYFNSGVIFMKDTPGVHKFFDDWHHFWETSHTSPKECYDQPAMMMADIENGHLIKELNGGFNCQILTNFKYLACAKIIHFFNIQWEGKEEISPFFKDSLYEEIKKTGYISEETRQLVDNCKTAFYAPVMYMSKEKEDFLSTLMGTTFYSLYKRKGILYKFIDWGLKTLQWMKHKI